MTINQTINPATGSVASVMLLSLVDIFGNSPSGFVPVNMTNTSGNVWSYTFNATSASYNYTYSFTISGGGGYGVFNGTVTGGSYVGRYTSESQLDEYLGSINVQIQSDTNSTGDEDALAVQQAIQAAEDEIDSWLSAAPTPYVIPLTFSTSYVNQALVLRANILAACILFEKRILVSLTKNWPMFRQMRTDAESWLTRVVNGGIVITGATQNVAKGTAPVVAGANVDFDGYPIRPNGDPLFGFNWPWG